MTIEIFDDRDRDLLVNSINDSILSLAKMRDKSAMWGCSTMTLQDTIDRLRRILREVTEAE